MMMSPPPSGGMTQQQSPMMQPPPDMRMMPMQGMESGRMMPPPGDMQRGMQNMEGKQMQGMMQDKNSQMMGQMDMRQMGDQKMQMQQRGMMNGSMMNGGGMTQGKDNSEQQEKMMAEQDAQMKKQQAAQWARGSAQLEKQVKKLRSDLEKAKKKKDAASYPSVIAQVETEVAAVEAKWGEIKGLASGGDIESAVDEISDLHESLADAQRSVGFIAQLSSVAKMTKNAEREITAFEKQVARAEKKKIDMSSVRSLIAEGRAKLAELKALGGKSNVSPDDFFGLMEDLGDIRQNAVEEFNRLNGEPKSSALGAAVFKAVEMRRAGF